MGHPAPKYFATRPTRISYCHYGVLDTNASDRASRRVTVSIMDTV